MESAEGRKEGGVRGGGGEYTNTGCWFTCSLTCPHMQ